MPDPIIFTSQYLAKLPSLRRYGSPTAHNVALRPGVPMQQLREVLEKYVREMPAADKAKVIERLHSSNDEAFTTAEYEVLLYAFFRSRGHAVQLNVPLGDGDADLLVGTSSESFFVEIATL